MAEMNEAVPTPAEPGDLRVTVAGGDMVDRVEVWTGNAWLRLRGVEPSGLRFRLFPSGVEAIVDCQFYCPAACQDRGT